LADPGFKKEDFKVTAEDGMLTISAETSFEKNKEKENYIRKEFSCSSFTRSFNLSENMKGGNINARYRDGLLSIELKKYRKSVVPKKAVKVE
jgi:HSP20 family protein